jgi:hypothetical protein
MWIVKLGAYGMTEATNLSDSINLEIKAISLQPVQLGDDKGGVILLRELNSFH